MAFIFIFLSPAEESSHEVTPYFMVSIFKFVVTLWIFTVAIEFHHSQDSRFVALMEWDVILFAQIASVWKSEIFFMNPGLWNL